jgi:ElaB/YqjD/DUF883 family membrane-anchored ribosome-binding protein
MVDTARWNYPPDMIRAASYSNDAFAGWVGERLDRIREFVREKPEQAIVMAVGIGFVLGWKLKPW